LRARFDNDRVPSRRFRLSDFRTTVASVLKARDLRRLSFACFAFNGVQSVFTAYFVTYLVALDYELAAAGFLFSLVVAVAVAVPCRILWGWLGSFHVAPRLVMACLALGMAGSIAVTGLFTAAWPMAAMGLVGGVLSATAMSWHGILLSETARLAPAGRVGAVTGGVLSFGQIGAFLGPSAFSLLLHMTGGYGAGWGVCAIPALWVGISLLRPRAPAERGEALTARTVGVSPNREDKSADRTEGVEPSVPPPAGLKCWGGCRKAPLTIAATRPSRRTTHRCDQTLISRPRR
jgi:MFS family permease